MPETKTTPTISDAEAQRRIAAAAQKDRLSWAKDPDLMYAKEHVHTPFTKPDGKIVCSDCGLKLS